jgi:2',3'-cyclic-nucleotide 2'-phosphodiesterase (5'-nucleotidase family)
MKVRSPLLLVLFSLAALPLSSAVAQTTQVGTILVQQNDGGDTAASVTPTRSAGSSSFFNVSSRNRGEYFLQFENPDNVAAGTLVTSIAENGRNNTAFGDTLGLFYATSSAEISGTRFIVSVNDSARQGEVNINAAAGFFPYSRWLGGFARNAAGTNGGPTNQLRSHASIRLGTEFRTLGTGVFLLDLQSPAAGGYSPLNGVLLVAHAKDEANYATSRANPDGTFNLYVRGNDASSIPNEQDPISFVYLPTTSLNTDGLIALGRVNSNATTDVLAGPAQITKGPTGRWYLKIDGHSPETGTLLISAEGGAANNIDNIVSYQWDAANNRYIIESRDIQPAANGDPRPPPPLPGLQNGAATEDMFSFAFFRALKAPSVSIKAPLEGDSRVTPATFTVEAEATDEDDGISRVEFLINGVLAATDTTAPFELPQNALPAGSYRYTARAVDINGLTANATVQMSVTLDPNVPVANSALWFDGVNDHVTLGTAPELGVGGPPSNGFTLECWFRKEGQGVVAGGLGNLLPLISKGRGQADNSTLDINYGLGLTAGGLLSAQFEAFPVNGVAGGADFSATATHTPVVDGQWHHAAVTYNGTTGTWEFYLDGAPAGTVVGTPGALPRYDSIQPFGIATAFASDGVPQGAFPGVIDEVRIWNYARSATDILSHRDAFVLDAGGLVGRLGLDDGRGAQTSSSAGKRTRGTLVNGPVWVNGAPMIGQAPQVALTRPLAGDRFLPGTSVFLAAAAADVDGNVTKVEFFEGSNKLGEVTASPFVFEWTGVAAGSYSLTAVATDASGLVTTSDVVVVQVGDVSPLIISEVQSSQSATAPVGAGDYWELTNAGAAPILLSGYRWDDSRRSFTTALAWAIPADTTVAAGESVIFTKADPATFRAWWGLQPTVQVIQSLGAPDLDANDSITLYDSVGTVVTSLSYAQSGFNRSNGLPSLGGHAGESAGGAATAALVWEAASGFIQPRYAFAGAGTNGGVTAVTGNDVGSPGNGGGPVQEPAVVLSLAIAPKVFLESSVNPASVGTLFRSGDTTAALEVSLLSSDISEVTVPALVTIPAGQASVTFAVTAVNDFLVDAAQTVQVSALAPGTTLARQELTVLDDGDLPPPDLRVTEVQSSQSPEAPAGAADYWELTNFSNRVVSLESYTWDDSRRDVTAAQAWKLPAGITMAIGESVIITTADPAAFRAWWGLAPTVQVLQTPGAPTLDADDSITLYTESQVEVFTFGYAANAFTRTFGLPSLGGQAGPSAGAANDFIALIYDPASTAQAPRYLAANGYRLGGRFAAVGTDVGSPGVINGASVTPPAPAITTRGPLQFTHVSTVPLAGSEISAYDAASKRLFVTSNVGLQILAMNDPAFPVNLGTVNFTQAPFNLTSTDITSVAVRNGVVAVAVPNAVKDQPGRVVFLNAASGAMLSIVTVGVLPDMITFTPNGARVLTANEGEMQNGGADTAPGSVSIIEVAGGFAAPTVTTVGFTAFDAQAAALKAAGVRIFENPPGSGTLRLPSLDFEPEYIAVAPDNLTAMVVLQEANAVAILDLTAKAFTSIRPLGEKDFSTLLADFSDRDAEGGSTGANLLTTGNPVFGLYMPDAITAFQAKGQTYYVTANEGDDRDDFQTETIRVGAGGYILDPTVFPNAAELKANNKLGRLTVSNSAGLRGDTDNDGDVDRILAYGGRSISILNAAGEIVYDSADLMERLVSSLGEPWLDDGRSDNKAAEPEGVAIGEIEGRLYAFVGLERARGVMVFDITDPARVAQAGFVSLPSDMNPEGITFITGAQSPNGQPMIAVTNETSNTLSLFNVSRFTLQLLHFSDAQGGLLAPQTAPNLAALVDAFDQDYANTLIVSGGDSFLPGSFLSAGADPALNAVASVAATATGRPDLAIHNLIGVEAAILGHHEWDLGSAVLANALQPAGAWVGAQFPLLSLNLDFSADSQLSGLVTTIPLDTDDSLVPEASAVKGRLVPVTVVNKGGEKIGLIGVTTQLLASLTSLEGTVVKGGNAVNLDVLAAQIQPSINELSSEGVSKIVLLSHLNDLALERALAVKLADVDIIVAAGSETRLGDSDDTAVTFPGHEATFEDSYPLLAEDRNGTPLLIVNTDSEYSYLGRLVVDFDLEGRLITSSLPDRLPENGAFAATAANVAAAWGVAEANLATTAFAAGTKGAQVKQVTDAVQAVMTAKDSIVYGYSAVYLEGAAPSVRSQETNLGNLVTDANQQAVREIVGGSEAIVSLKHAGGITGPVGSINGQGGVAEKGPTLANASVGKPAGAISKLDIENALRGNQKLMVFETTPAGLKAILEHSVSQGTNQAQFPQLGGVQFAWDPDLTVGSRVQSIALLKDDGSAGTPVYKAGNLGSGMLPGAPAVIQVVTLNGLANGEAGYPMKANGENFRYVLGDGTLGAVVSEGLDFTAVAQVPVNGLSEQESLAEHVQNRHGNLAQAYRVEETGAQQDTRTQNVNVRADTVPPVTGADSDGDGLTDIEEILLGIGGNTFLRVGDYVDLNLGAFAAPGQTLKIVGRLPAGLTFNAITGRLSGVLTGTASLYDLQLLVMQGTIPLKAYNLQITVEAFPARLLAGYEALLVDANGLPKGILRLTATRPSLWTGSLEVIGQGRRAGTGSFVLVPGRQRAEIQMLFKGTATVPQANVTVTINAESALVTGTFASGTVTGDLRGFRLASLGGSPPTIRKLNLVLDAGVQDGVEYPAGFGWAKGSVTTKGAVSLKGQLGDTQALVLTANLGVTGQALVWTQPYKNKVDSYFGGVMPLPNLGQPEATVEQLVSGTWWYKAADAKELSYDAGFAAPLPVTPVAAAFDTVKTTTELETALGLTASTLNVEIEGAGLSSTTGVPIVLPTAFTLASNFSLTTSAPVSGPPAAWTGKVNKADGSLTGTLTLPASEGTLAGKAAASAVLLQELPSGETVGAGLIRVPVPGKKGQFRTSSLLIEK